MLIPALTPRRRAHDGGAAHGATASALTPRRGGSYRAPVYTPVACPRPPPDGGITLTLRPPQDLPERVGHAYGGLNRAQVRARPVRTADSTPRHPTHLNALSGR